MIKDLLPIGSIVLLKDTPKKIMVNGEKRMCTIGKRMLMHSRSPPLSTLAARTRRAGVRMPSVLRTLLKRPPQ